MELIPVIDILEGITVHALRGKRKEYQPLRSVLCSSAEPLVVASAFKACGFKKLYIADLDAIMHNGSNFRVLKEIIKKTGLDLIVDSGLTDESQIREILQSGVSQVIIGTETLPNLNLIKYAIANLGSARVIVSLDLIDSQVLSSSEQIKSMSCLDLAIRMEKMGVSKIIVLDLSRVGSNEGVDYIFLKKLLSMIKINILVGGGVRDIKDLLLLKNMGISSVLLASALHSGNITIDALYREGLLKNLHLK